MNVTFNKVGYDPFIDFLKGLCIVSVVLTHSIPYEWQQMIGFSFWGAQAVPIFLMIQSFHYLKHEQLPHIDWKKLFKRIVLPFLVTQAIIVVGIGVMYLCGSGVLSTPLKMLIRTGGSGPGSYYFWIYLQFALILLPAFGWLQKKWQLKSWMWLLIFVVISEGLEIMCSFVDIPPLVYRLLAIRYVFLVYGGYVWVQEGVQLNWKTIVLSIISIASIYLWQYQQMSLEPWVFDTDWRYFHWFCYFLAMFGLIVIANLLLKIRGGVFAESIKHIGKYSYEIFMFQMLVFHFYPMGGNRWIYMIVTTILSIVPVMLYFNIKEKWQIISK